ncbi:MAG: sigma-70 family RNA polymerase sigma factor [Bacteroidia bacterium]|nr:sigma-70 family RNA polymerase sigma factor [Bacteroidia bacterium]
MKNKERQEICPKVVISEWVQRYSDSLYAFAIKRVSSEAQAKDLVQNTFLIAYESFHRFEGRSKPKTWLTSILNNKIMDHYRQVYRRKEVTLSDNQESFDHKGAWLPEHLPQDYDLQQVLDQPDFLEVFDSCLDCLPDRWRASIEIKYLQSDISLDELGITKANYWKMLERARVRLRGCLEKNWFKPTG